jgi:hypothetical protein
MKFLSLLVLLISTVAFAVGTIKVDSDGSLVIRTSKNVVKGKLVTEKNGYTDIADGAILIKKTNNYVIELRSPDFKGDYRSARVTGFFNNITSTPAIEVEAISSSKICLVSAKFAGEESASSQGSSWGVAEYRQRWYTTNAGIWTSGSFSSPVYVEGTAAGTSFNVGTQTHNVMQLGIAGVSVQTSAVVTWELTCNDSGGFGIIKNVRVL